MIPFAKKTIKAVFSELVFCHEKQENSAILHLQAYLSVIPARFWPESRKAADWIPAKGMPEWRHST